VDEKIGVGEDGEGGEDGEDGEGGEDRDVNLKRKSQESGIKNPKKNLKPKTQMHFTNLQNAELEELLTIARSLCWDAADIALSYYYEDSRQGGRLDLQIQHQADGPVTTADVAVSDYLLNNLQRVLGSNEFGYLSEETYKLLRSPHPIQKPWVWIIDPVDGTRSFIDREGEFAIHVALVRQKRPVLAVMACPIAGRLYYAILGKGAWVETRARVAIPIQVSLRNYLPDLVMLTSRGYRNQRLDTLLQQFPCPNQRHIGSIGCKIAAILEHKADVYMALSGKTAPKDWDYAAPELILTEAGGQFTHFDGSPLLYNTGDISQWGGILGSNGSCHRELCTQAEQLLAEIDHRIDPSAH
jgi:3'(2'), 5'-bisphosphate nucleotidase